MISVYASDPDLVYMSDRNIYLTYKVIKAGRDFTKIYKVSVWRNRIIPVGDSEMKGTIHHRYALSEISGTILRIVVTRLGWGSVTISVYVFNFKL